MSGWLYHVYSFRKWVHHVHNCWLRSHIEFWILKSAILDLQLMTFGSKTLMLGSKKSIILGCKPMILGSKMILGPLGGIYGPSWPQEHLKINSKLRSSILGRLLGPLFGAPKRPQIDEKTCGNILLLRWVVGYILDGFWDQLGPNLGLKIHCKSVRNRSKSHPKPNQNRIRFFDSFF